MVRSGAVESVFSTPALLCQVAMRLPEQRDVCNLRATNRSAAVGIDEFETKRMRDHQQPHIFMNVQYQVIGKVRNSLDGSILAEGFTRIDLFATEQPTDTIRSKIDVKLNIESLREVWAKHITRQMEEGAHDVKVGYLACTMYLGSTVKLDTAIRMLNKLIKEEIGWDRGNMVIKPSSKHHTELQR